MRRSVLATIWIAGLVFGALMPLAAAETGSSQGYLVVLVGQQTGSGFVAEGAVSTAKGLVAAAGGTVANDLSRQIGVLVVESTNPALADTLRASALVEEVGNDFSWKAFESTDEALAGGATVIQDEGGGPEPSSDGLPPAGHRGAQSMHPRVGRTLERHSRRVDQ